MKIDLLKILDGMESYPTWFSKRTYKFILEKVGDNKIRVIYPVNRKQISSLLPRFIEIDEPFLWVLGFIEGEGLKSKGQSAYRRFMVTNNDFKNIKMVLDVLEKNKLLSRKNLPKHSIRIRYNRFHNKKWLSNFWSKNLIISKDKLYFSPNPDPLKKSKFGTCDIYINNVIFRRVIDEIKNFVRNQIDNYLKD